MAEDEEFKVKIIDRRRFNSDGDVRDGVPEDEPTPEPAPAPRPEPSRSEPPPPEAAGRGDRPPMDFLTFIASLATNALAAFGMLPEEQAKGLPVNPELGREYVEILGMLADKTQGNLSPEEDRAFQRILGDLRMAYVEISKRAGPQ
jgi:hypothetical protein